ncbi:MAG TPA: homoserine dehydrogenase [Thermoanaerobaculia bacterium]|jgi:homoserine dehydrogenase|nr:homoserine dehydrogenase [Thermoanaerobaculia bacterium]
MKQTSVLKFGSSVLRSDADLPLAVHEIYREWRAGRRVLAVVSALGCTSDDLLKRAQQLGLPPQREGLAALLGTVEMAAAALLTLALDRSGLPATLLDPTQIGLVTRGDDRLDAEPAAVDIPYLDHELDRAIVVVPASAGRDSAGHVTRMDSNLTARFLARKLGVACPDRVPPRVAGPPLRVALLGCGTVGGGVLARLLALPALFRVIGVAVRDLGRVREPAVPRRLLTDDPAALLARDADVVVELLGGREPAHEWITLALDSGRHVVTANKALLAGEVENLSERARRRGVSLRFSASVGGALPALEAVRRAAAAGRVQSITGVLNGTCNFVLDRCAAGASFAEAVALAREAGYAEADPTLDLDGSDAAQKLSLLVREAFGVSLPWENIPRRGIADLDERAAAEAVRRGRRLRLVAACERREDGLRASVQPLDLSPDHPCAWAAGAENALVVQLEGGGQIRIAARGAGRWPTTEAVMADLYDLAEDVEWRKEGAA